MGAVLNKTNISDNYPFITDKEGLEGNKLEHFKNYAIEIKGDNLLESVGIKLHSKNRISGIYFLFTRDRKLIYVGKSINLRSRLRQHLKGNDNPTKHILDEIKYIKIVICKGSDYFLYRLENEFIKEMKPMFNGGGSIGTERTYGFSNLRQKLNSLKDKMEILVDIEKWNDCFIDVQGCHQEETKITKKESVMIMESKENEKNSFLEAIKESIKLAVKHESEENADRIIYGFLNGLSK